MASSSESWYYIACTDIQLKEESQGIGSKIYGFVNPSLAVTRLLQGELLSIKPKSYSDSDEVHGCAASDPSKTFKVKDSQVSYLAVKEYDILAAIEKPSDRWDLFCNKDAFQAILTLKTDDRVWVSIPVGRHSSGMTGSSRAEGVIRYIGAMEGKVGTFFGIELKEPKGSGNGTYRHTRYFLCGENCGIFLPAEHLNISHKKLPSVNTRQEERASSGEIGEGDEVYMIDKNRKRVDGTVKWAKHTKDGFLLGIETKKTGVVYAEFPEHIHSFGHHFKNRDFKKHSYLVLPAKSVQKERGTPVADKGSFQMVHHSNCSDVSESLHSSRSAASTVAKEANVSISDFLNDQRKAAEMVERNHEKVKAKEFGLSPQDIKSQTEEMQKFQQEKRAADNARWASQKPEFEVPPASSYEQLSGDSNRRKSEEDILPSHEDEDQPLAVYNRQQSEGASPKLQHKSRSPHSFSVGSLVQVHIADQDMPSYGTIRWIGPLLIQRNRTEDIAGVELETLKPGIGNGSWKGVEYFKCDPGYGLFVVLNKLQPDDRYPVYVERGHNRFPDSAYGAAGVLSTMVKDFKQLQEDHRRLITNHNTLESSNQLLVEKVQRLECKCNGLETTLQDQQKHLQNRADDHQKLLQDHAALLTSLAQLAPSLQTALKKISDLEKTVQEMQPSWSIAPSELQTTKEIIGGGGWGQVTVGYYHGTKVAVKEMYSIIVSDYNRHTFQREMRISSLVRHPNLLLFMGAVTTGNLRIVTEIMDTSLRKIMENGRLTPVDIAPIGKDVACALNYLHSRPDPIIHRDVSSANVLLNGKQKGWVAKLGDFGSANFLNKTNTQIPGAQLYSAPEALNSSKAPQGPKMDTYSFGVLLLEMCVCKLPEPAILHEAQQTLHQWDPPRRAVGELGVRCIKPDPDQRPYMMTIIKELE